MREITVSPDTAGPSVVPQFIPVEFFFWSTPLLSRIVEAIEQGTITSGADWKKIAKICSIIPDAKRIWFYRELERVGLSRASLAYLFDGWKPGDAYPHRRPKPWAVKP